jgi:transposase-like protein
MGKRFGKEFKIEAVRLASEPGNTQSGIERDLGISQGIENQPQATQKALSVSS